MPTSLGSRLPKPNDRLVYLSEEKGLTLTVTPGIPISGTKTYDFVFKAGIKKVF